MKLVDLINRNPVPAPWHEGDNIPWNEPRFSERMLNEHLSQAHDAASRRAVKIDEQVNWIHHKVLQGQTTRILDLGCGPGLYTSRLARLGHTCVGIDYSPASIQYAIDCAAKENLRCTYLQQDIRRAEFGTGFGVVMLLYGEFNVFRPDHAQRLVCKAYGAMAEGGLLLLEPHTFEGIRKISEQHSSWYSSATGLFSDQPHLYLKESFWDSDSEASTVRHWIVDATTFDVTRHAASYQAYTDEQYRHLLSEYGFRSIEFYPSLTGQIDESSVVLMALVARKQVNSPAS